METLKVKKKGEHLFALLLCLDDCFNRKAVVQNLPFEIVFSKRNCRFSIGCGNVHYTHFVFGFFDFYRIKLLGLASIGEQIF